MKEYKEYFTGTYTYHWTSKILHKNCKHYQQSSDTPKTDREQSKKLLLDTIMKKCDITENDLDNISVVKSKLRDFKLNDILETSFWKKLF